MPGQDTDIKSFLDFSGKTALVTGAAGSRRIRSRSAIRWRRGPNARRNGPTHQAQPRHP